MGNDAGSQGKAGSPSTVAITVALIGAAATVGVALIANWRHLFPDAEARTVDEPVEVAAPVVTPTIEPEPSKEPEPVVPPKSPEELLRDAERVASMWMESFLNGDVDGIVGVCTTPFYFDREIVLGPAQLRERMEQIVTKKQGDRARGETLKLEAIRAGTVADFKRESTKDISQTRMFTSIRVNDDDFIVDLGMRHPQGGQESAVFLLRRIDDRLVVFGFED